MKTRIGQSFPTWKRLTQGLDPKQRNAVTRGTTQGAGKT